MRTFLLSMAGAFVALGLFAIIGLFMLFSIIGAATSVEKQPSDLVLTLDLNVPLTDQAPLTGFEALSGRPGFIDLLAKIDAATSDPNVKGMFVRAPQLGIGSSRAEELRGAIKDFQDAGKYVIAHSQGSFSTGPSGLRAISAADEIWVQPGTDQMTTGVSFETLFLKGLLDNLSVISEIEAFYEYKNAPNTFKETDYTAPHREAMTVLADSLWTESLNDIAADRGLPVATLRAELEAGPMSADRLVDFKLMDTLGWPEEAAEAARDRGGEGNLLELAKYTPPSVGARAEHIAVVGGEGAIVTGGTTGSGPFSDGSAFSSDPIANSILEAGRNEKVKAIVFRVDSPGGSPTASDQIWRAIERVQEDGKPVVVSMGSLAASGGYYVSTGADYILASRSTITGSIGIFGGKQTISGGLERVGINPRTLSVGGDFADAFGTDPFTDAQREDLIASLKRGYDRFTGLVAEGRDMTIEDVHEVARGRVWSGADAFTRGLVDETGGFLDAIDKAKDLAGIDADAKVRLVNYPARKTGFEALEDLFGASEDVARAASVIGALAGDERLDAALTQMQLLQTERSQVMGPILIER